MYSLLERPEFELNVLCYAVVSQLQLLQWFLHFRTDLWQFVLRPPVDLRQFWLKLCTFRA